MSSRATIGQPAKCHSNVLRCCIAKREERKAGGGGMFVCVCVGGGGGGGWRPAIEPR